ncbi:MAG: cytochrome-c oxidase, cbb3-type subunit III [Xanthomonadales bacterium PRO7]|jgi:cytochrome c oxidase cbb3-type subunit 3|nr:cytochrome-c oxidase, cbb3-type subunit III [Xanthomonadales bacterium PRO7]HMM57174.1 cytochrome-c oxidase, cbb3-type subunit III [Rudaea sp.]
MSNGWSLWVMFLVVFNLGITFFLFLWAPRAKIPTLPDGTSGHVWAHGVLREGVRKLPMWWILLSAAMFVAGFAYLFLFPGFGNHKGYLGWTSHGQLARETASNDARLDAAFQRFDKYSIEQLAGDHDALAMGEVLFRDNCAACHGRDAHGNTLLGAPNLADNDWLYGGDGKAILTSILDGRHGAMPAWGPQFGDAGVANLANYVLSLSGAPHDATKAIAGKALFTVCAACHGPEGKGNPALGAPNLTDTIWLYGGDLESVESSIRDGRSGNMPTWRARLGENDARVIAAYVYSLSHGDPTDTK